MIMNLSLMILNLEVDRCYDQSLELEETDTDRYLECLIHNSGTKIDIQHFNKNHDSIQGSGLQEFYVHQHAHSFNGPTHKWGAMIGTFLRMHGNCTDPTLLYGRVLAKRVLNY